MVKAFAVGTALLAMLATSAAHGQEPTSFIERQSPLGATASGSDDERRVAVGSFIASEFSIDPFTLFVNTLCIN